MKVNAYTNSLTTSEKEKMTTVRIPGTEIGKTTRISVPSRDAPSIWAASSSSWGMVLKNPIKSQVAKGTVNDGYTRTSDQIEPRRWKCRRLLVWLSSWVITENSGRNSNVGGTRYVRKMPTPTLWPNFPESRASA